MCYSFHFFWFNYEKICINQIEKIECTIRIAHQTHNAQILFKWRSNCELMFKTIGGYCKMSINYNFNANHTILKDMINIT